MPPMRSKRKAQLTTPSKLSKDICQDKSESCGTWMLKNTSRSQGAREKGKIKTFYGWSGCALRNFSLFVTMFSALERDLLRRRRRVWLKLSELPAMAKPESEFQLLKMYPTESHHHKITKCWISFTLNSNSPQITIKTRASNPNCTFISHRDRVVRPGQRPQ